MDLLRRAATSRNLISRDGRSVSVLGRGRKGLIPNGSSREATLRLGGRPPQDPINLPSHGRTNLAWLSTDTKTEDELSKEDDTIEVVEVDPFDAYHRNPRRNPRRKPLSRQSDLEETTQHLLNEQTYPVGSLDLETMLQMRRLTAHWTDLGTPLSVHRSLELMDRLVAEQKLNFSAELTEERIAGILDYSLLNSLSRNWRFCYERRRDDSLISPQALLEKLQEWTQQFPLLAIETDNMHSILLGAVSRVETLEDALYVESLVHYMAQEFQGGNARIAPSILEYNILLNAFAKAKAPERAEAVLDKLCDDYATGVSMLRPQDVSFQTVLYAWKHAKAEHGGQRAEAVLAKMKKFGEMEDDPLLRHPDHQSYASVLGAWCAQRTRESLERAERFLQKMHDDYQAGNADARPTNANYGLLVHSWAQAGYSEESERVLRWMHDDYVQNGNLQAQPTSYHFNPLIASWGRRGDQQGIGKAFSLFESMHTMNVEPDSATFGALITSLSRSKDKRNAAKQSERLLREQQKLYREGNHGCKPDPINFNAVMHCWSAVGNAKRAVALLSELVEEHKNGSMVLKDDRPFFTALVALSRCQYPDKAMIAERLFQQLKMDCNSGQFNFQPSAHSYIGLMGCWASSELPESGEKCLALLHEMQARYRNGDEMVQPTEAHFKTVMDAFARIRNPQQVEAVWAEMLQSALEGNSKARPGSNSCFTLLSSWLMSETPEGVDRAVELMDQVAEINRTGTSDVKLSRDGYYLLFDICVKSKTRAIKEGAEKILRKMKEIHNGGLGEMEPDKRCYNIVINCWGMIGVAEKSEALFWEMYQQFVKDGNHKVRPDEITVATVLKAWSRSESESAAIRAQTFFERIEKLISKGQLQHIKLDPICYASLLNCLANAKTEEAMENAEALFAKLQELYRSGDNSMKPTLGCYEALVKCRAGMQHFESAESLVSTMLDFSRKGENDLKPTLRLCKWIVSEWANSSSDDAPVHAERFLRWMSQNLWGQERPDQFIYASVLRCWARSRRPESGVRSENLLTEMVKNFGSRKTVLECCSDVVCAHGRSNNLERAEMLLSRLCDDYLSNRTGTQPDQRAFIAVLAAMSRAQPRAAGMRTLRILQSLREVKELASQQHNKPSYSKVLECWNRSSLSNEEGLRAFLSVMEDLDTPSTIGEAPATDDEEPPLAFKY